MENYGLFYSFNKDRESLLILFSDEEITYQKTFGKIEVSYHNVDVVSYRIKDINKIIKIYAEGLIPMVNKEILSIINNAIIKEGLTPLKEKEHSDFYNGIVELISPITVRTIDGKYVVDEDVKVKENDHVVLIKKGSFFFDKTILKNNHLCTNKELGIMDNDNIYTDPDLDINEDFFITK